MLLSRAGSAKRCLDPFSFGRGEMTSPECLEVASLVTTLFFF